MPVNEKHTPVLAEETLSYLLTNRSGTYFDGTFGFGGHASLLLDQLNNDAIYVGTDVDSEAFGYSQSAFSNDTRVRLYRFPFTHIGMIAKIEGGIQFEGVFVDLGVSSVQLDDPKLGFTYREKALLDLRLDKTSPQTAADLVNSYEKDALMRIFFTYGEEKNARKIAEKICENRQKKMIATTFDMVEIVEALTPVPYRRKTLSRVFQALRIAVNNELEVLETFLKNAIEVLRPGGRIVILSYHSLEDRIVKNFFKYEASTCTCPQEVPVCVCGKKARLKILTTKPVTPGETEVVQNFRSRSAKLRAAERI